MKTLLLLFLLALTTYSAVSPIWSETPRVDTGNKILVNNHLSTTGSYNWSTSYHSNKTFSAAPWVGLSIRQLRIASNLNQIGFHSFITGSPTLLSFYHMVNTFAPTQIWYLEICYIAYDGSFQQFTDIDLTYKLFNNADVNGIDSSPGTYRWKNLNTGMTVTSGNTIKVAAFTAGFIGTFNNTYFQVNVTEQIVGTDIELNVTVHPDTLIQQISFYVIRADITSLLTRCWIFVETAISQASNGRQYSFFIPTKVNYATNYISGLRSFSLIENIQYNFTVSGLNFTTYSNSFYNDVRHFNLWVRICPSPYTLFNQVDFLCYTSCPAGTYLQSADSICFPCYYTCATCTDSATCVTCGPNRVLDASGNCNCKDYYYEYNSVCVACHYSCQQCTHSGQYFNCMACDTNMHRQMGAATNSTCYCTTGFIDYGSTLCDEKCGDGFVYVDPCDDGNTVDGDGCSSICQRQTYYTCDNPTPPAVSPASQCFFVGNITIKVVRVQKDPNRNLATFFLKVEPLVPKFSELTAENMVTNLEGATFQGVSFDGQYIKYNITYTVPFQGSTIVFGLKPSATGVFSRFDPKNDTFKALGSNGLYLFVYSDTDYTNAEKLGLAAMIMGYAFSAFALILCFAEWKQLGLELFFSLQLCFMSAAVQIYHHPFMTKMLQVRGVMGWSGEVAQKIPPYHTAAPVLEHLGYSVGFEYNFNIMVIFPGLAFILYLAYRGALYRHEKLRLEGKTNKQFEELIQGKILKHFKFEFFVYWMLFNMQQILISTVIQSQYIENGAIYIFIVVCLAGILASIIALFIRPGSTQAFRAKLFHKSYGNKTFLMVLVATLIIDLLMLLTVLVNRYIFYASFACPLIVGIYVIGRRPFKLMWNNIRLFIIQLCLIAVIALQVATMGTDYTVHKSFPEGILICMGIIMLVTLISWIYDVVKKICKMRRKDDYEQSSKYESQKEEESINEKVREAGFALVHGNPNASRLPPTYEMANAPVSGRKPTRSNVEPLKSPRTPRQNQTGSLKRPINERLNTNRPKSKLNPKDEQYEANKKSKQYEELRKRQDTEERTERPSTRRQRINPYQQILNETASKIN